MLKLLQWVSDEKFITLLEIYIFLILFFIADFKGNKTSLNNFKYFRIGNFDDAEDSIKTCWYFFVGKIMSCINRDWNDERIRLTSLLSSKTTSSDEALAIIFLEKKLHYWIEQVNDEYEQETENDSVKQQQTQRKLVTKDSFFTNEEIENFYNKQVMIEALRQDEITGESWDKGYLNYIRSIKLSPTKKTKNTYSIMQLAFCEGAENSTVSSFKASDSLQQSEDIEEEEKTRVRKYNLPIDIDDDA